MQNAAAWIMYEWFGGKRAGGMDGWSDGKVRGLGGWQLTCQRAHHISSQPNETKRNAPLPSPTKPPILPFMRTKANKQQNICMLSQTHASGEALQCHAPRFPAAPLFRESAQRGSSILHC